MPPNIFSSAPTTKALITLILIENSQRMSAVWNDLRQHHLPTLLGSMRMANPVVSIPVLWLTTTPVGDDAASLHSALPRQYNQLPELKFSFTPDNRITSRIVNRAIELMLEAALQFQGGPVSFHLFVVAASTPMQDTWDVSVTMPSQIGQSEWRLLGQRIAQLGIHCHMILPTSEDMSPMRELFATSIKLQGHTQVSPWFPTRPGYTFLLSGEPSGSSTTGLPPTEPSNSPFRPLDPSAIDPVERQPLSPVARPHVLRHQSFPQDVQSAPSAAPVAAQNGTTPSLVSSLQKVHGLSRKKLYGTQPPRQPFVREEPVRTKYKSTAPPLSISVGSQSFSIPEEARTVSKTRIEHGRRADRSPHIGDKSNPTSPGRKSPWSHSFPSDVGSLPSSPTVSLSSHHTPSPIMQPYPELAGYLINPPATLANFPPSVVSSVPVPEASFSAPLQGPGTYFSISSFQSPSLPISSQGPAWTAVSMPTSTPAPMAKSVVMPSTVRRRSQELSHGPHMQSLDAMSSKYRLESTSTDPRSIPKNTQKVKDAGDVPFIFSPELEAATAAKLKAALQSTPTSSPPSLALTQVTAFTSGTSANYAATENGCDASLQSPPLLPRPFGHDAVEGVRPMMLANGVVNGELYLPRFVGSPSSSSLQGWAG